MSKVVCEIIPGIMVKVKEIILAVINAMEKLGIPRALQAILLTGLVLGTLYTFIVPPWWHYDEASHFEQVWLIANRYHLPTADEYDAEVRREIAESMIEHKWYSIRNMKLPDLNNNPVYIGPPQNSGPRLYYIYSALPLQFVKGADMVTQCRAARLGSVLLFLGFLVICWKLMKELVPANHPLQWLVPAFAVLLPGLLDTMTSVNDDVGAVFAFSLFLLLSVRIIKKGFSILNLAGLSFALLLCYLTKDTTWFAFVLTPLVFLQGIFRQRLKWLAWALIIGGALAGIAAAFSWGDALYWYKISSQANDTRLVSADAPHGNAIFQVDASKTTQAGQFINSNIFYQLRGKTLTLGAWIWADKPAKTIFPFMAVTLFDDDINSQLQVLSSELIQATSDPITHKAAFDIPDTALIQITTEPTFHSVTFTVPDNAARGWLFLYLPSNAGINQKATFYYDGVVLAEGKFNDGVPKFNDNSATNGTWNKKPFTNFLRNGSAELSGPRIYPWVDAYSTFIPTIAGKASLILDAVIDQKGTSWYFRLAVSGVFQTFWSKFAAGKVLLLSVYAYELLQYLTMFAALGVLLRAIIGWKSFPWDIALPFGLSMLFMWSSAILRGAPELSSFMTVLPWARYALPSIIPTSAFICAGWLSIARLLKRFGLTDVYFGYGFLAFMISLNIFTAFSVYSYFSDQTRTIFNILFLITIFAVLCLVVLVSKPAQKGTQS
jgi:hypothetical protein